MGAFFKTPRTIRLAKEYEEMKAYKRDSSILDFEVSGDPPDRYLITFHGNSLVPGGKGGEGVTIGKKQQVLLTLGGDYPRSRPDIDWKTPIVHPNISTHSVCLGNYANSWTPYFRLVDLIEILWDYARLAILNPEGGYRQQYGQKEWESMRRHFKFPVDLRPLRDKAIPADAGSSVLRPGRADGSPYDIVIMPDEGCDT
jgi:ubiquitin-protein ligase